jgi:hypothetical protein
LCVAWLKCVVVVDVVLVVAVVVVVVVVAARLTAVGWIEPALAAFF